MGHRGLLKQITNRQAFFGVMAVVMLLATFVSTIASAETLNDRSITPSTMSVSATQGSVQYQVEFTPEVTAGAFVIEFCNSASGPLLGQSCTGPAGMDVSGAASSGGTTVTSATANKIVATKSMTADTPETIVFTGLTNPTAPGVVYARIVTYTSGTGATGYQSTNPSAGEAVIDSGSVALYFNNTVSVSGTVLETLTFCVSGTLITPDCGAGSITDPTVKLGEEVAPGVIALVPGTISTGTLHTQINTNASSGAVIRLRSSAPCGGLMRAGSDVCDIEAAGITGLSTSDNSARFGVMTSAATVAVGATGAIGTIQPITGTGYNSSTYAFNYDELNSTTVGVTSTFGDPFLDTDGAPATNQNMALTFGATVGTGTPAGTYSTDLSMIAVGKF